ncbi:putative AMP-binding enzyme [Rosellinia necatrix]|uniref:Putative AMP-binding enzyme n=1 Tax=Rosellinia necatrix TaxID=77044 RepID=A0A1S8A8K7_ROSNE|nr:putative AMP-binding enzyme [Rosellinia necatrix]
MNTAEANVPDPQIRLLLETTYEALESSGQTIVGLKGSDTAVYVGQMMADYESLMLHDPELMGKYHATDTSRAMTANRVSYFFDWRGPSMTIDTACSSSLVAVHEAVQQLRTGGSRVAIAAGVNLLLGPNPFISESKLQMLSTDGRSRMWDADAKGYARGEGIAAVVLKRLADDEADGDHIECIIRQTEINTDGKTPGITMPSATSQADLMRRCYRRAGFDPLNPVDHPQFFEAHGTGTQAGDPIEAEAISSVFFPEDQGAERNGTEQARKMLVGSIKTVVGHTEGSAGLAGLLKASLALQHGSIPPNLLFETLNPRILPFYTQLHIPTQSMAWPTLPDAKCAARERKQPASGTSLLSCMTRLSEYLHTTDDNSINARDLAHTLYARRSRLQVATAISASSIANLRGRLIEEIQDARKDVEAYFRSNTVRRDPDVPEPKVLGVFTGQGAQWA